MATPIKKLYQQYVSLTQEIANINHAAAVLSWDKEVYLPKKGAQARAEQVATLASIAHAKFTDQAYGRLLEDLLSNVASLNTIEGQNVRLSYEEYQKATRLSQAFVEKQSLLTSRTYQAWIEARAKNDFDIMAPHLQKLIASKREESKLLATGKHPYDSMLDLYEPNLTVKKLDQVFEEAKIKLIPLLAKIKAAKPVKTNFLHKKYNRNKQWDFGLQVLNNMGYDFEAGRQDIAPHPFTISFAPSDVRVTTRIDENDLSNMVWSCIHEGGHALYEQGLSERQYGLPCGSACSLAIHESQSRLWENNVGRGISYWKYQLPILQEFFPKKLNKVGLQKFYKGINAVAPNLKRTEADELHYHLHVLIRYEIEKGIFEGKIKVEDLRQEWNDKYKAYLGVEVPSDNEGILQDVHWAHGSFGYFPTYSLGSFYAAQFYATAQKKIPNLAEHLSIGHTTPLLEWLRKNIHQHGRLYDAETLCKKVTGKPLDFSFFFNYVSKKYSEIYDI